jgi:DNA-binding GntR family transcriptional regulator
MTETASHAGKEAGIVRALEEDIIFGRLPPGTRLVEDALLARFPVTRHVIRQALVELERLGIVTRERNKGAAVRTLTPGEVRQIYEVRELLQRQAALTIPLPAAPDLIDRLRQIQADYEDQIARGHLRGVHECNDRFHLTLFGACGNDHLVSSIEHYMRLSLTIRAKTLADPAMLALSRGHHRMMIEMLKGRDSWALAQLCVDHLQPSKLDYLSRAPDAA